MSSIKSCRPATSTKTTDPVTLNEIFDKHNSTTALADSFLDREELPNERICLRFPNGQSLIRNWKSFKRELEAQGLELTGGYGRVHVSGYAPRTDFDGRIEVRVMMMKHLTNSKSFP